MRYQAALRPEFTRLKAGLFKPDPSTTRQVKLDALSILIVTRLAF
jgi:hypothetical protein